MHFPVELDHHGAPQSRYHLNSGLFSVQQWCRLAEMMMMAEISRRLLDLITVLVNHVTLVIKLFLLCNYNLVKTHFAVM